MSRGVKEVGRSAEEEEKTRTNSIQIKSYDIRLKKLRGRQETFLQNFYLSINATPP